MDGDSRFSWIIIGVLLILAAVFAVTETALSSVSRNRIKVLSERGDSRAKNALFALDHFDQAITTLLICTNIVHIAAASLVTVIVTRTWGLSAVSLSTVITTIVVFFVGEMLPKSIAKRNSEKFALQTAGLLVVLMKVLKPISFVLSKIGEFAAKRTKAEPEASVTEDELYDIIEDLTEEGSIDENQGELIASALSFGDRTVEAILTPRVDVIGLDVSMKREETLEKLQDITHSRVPVYEGSMDNIVGVLQVRKYLKKYLETREIPELRPLLDEVYFTPASTNLDELLEEMSKKKLNMAVIVDNYGGTMGIATVEDILEEIVGEIWDEDDVIKEPIVKLAEKTWLADAGETVDTIFEFMEYEDPEENEDFINQPASEWMLEELQAIPEKGDGFFYHELHVSAEEMEHNRIVKVRVEWTDRDHSNDAAEEDRDEENDAAAENGNDAADGTDNVKTEAKTGLSSQEGGDQQ